MEQANKRLKLESAEIGNTNPAGVNPMGELIKKVAAQFSAPLASAEKVNQWVSNLEHDEEIFDPSHVEQASADEIFQRVGIKNVKLRNAIIREIFPFAAGSPDVSPTDKLMSGSSVPFCNLPDCRWLGVMKSIQDFYVQRAEIEWPQMTSRLPRRPMCMILGESGSGKTVALLSRSCEMHSLGVYIVCTKNISSYFRDSSLKECMDRNLTVKQVVMGQIVATLAGALGITPSKCSTAEELSQELHHQRLDVDLVIGMDELGPFLEATRGIIATHSEIADELTVQSLLTRRK